MAVFKVKKGDTYESIARRSGVSAGAVMRYFKGMPIYKGMKYNTRKLAGMVQGGQAYAALSPDINPWGMPAGEIPDWAYETEAGTLIAENYLAAIGMTGFGAGEAGVETTTTRRPPAEEAPQALRGTEQLTTGAGGVTTGKRPPAAEAPQALMPGPEQLTTVAPDITPTTTTGPPGQPSPITLEPPVDISGALSEAYKKAAEWAMGTMLPEGYEAPGMGKPLGEVATAMTPEPGKRYRTPTDVSGQPTYEPGRGQAAIDVYQAIQEGETPGAISQDVANLLGYSDELLEFAGYVFNSETGQWELDVSGAEEEGGGEVAGGGTGTYGGGYGGYRRGRRGGYGRRSYGNTLYNGQVNTTFNWRIGWR